MSTGGPKGALTSAVMCGILLSVFEGVGVLVSRVFNEGTRPQLPPCESRNLTSIPDSAGHPACENNPADDCLLPQYPKICSPNSDRLLRLLLYVLALSPALLRTFAVAIIAGAPLDFRCTFVLQAVYALIMSPIASSFRCTVRLPTRTYLQGYLIPHKQSYTYRVMSLTANPRGGLVGVGCFLVTNS